MAPVPTFPRMNLGEEAIAGGSCVDRHDVEKQCSQVFSIGAVGMLPTPTEPLTLDVHQAALNQDRGPYES